MASSWATLSLLLLAAWSVGRGAAFKCYTCQNPTVSALCKNVTYCKPDATACMTTVVTVESDCTDAQYSRPGAILKYPFNGSPVVTRSCSTSCVATDPDSFGALHPIYCCFHNLCNVEG